jgi:hypothetical protein
MSRTRRLPAWSIALACALIFVFSSSPTQVLRALSGVVTSGPTIQDPVPPQDPAAPAPGRGGQGGRGGPVPYAQVVTNQMKSDDGVFKVHHGPYQNNDSILFEIPTKQFDKDFVWDVSIKKTTLGAGFGGQSVSSPHGSVHQARRPASACSTWTTASPATPMKTWRRPSPMQTIRRLSPRFRSGLRPEPGSGGRHVDLLQRRRPEFRAAGAIGGRGVATDRSFLESAVSFPENVNVEAMLTFTGGAADAGGGGGGRGGGGGAARGMRGPSGTVGRASQHPAPARHADDGAELRPARRLRHG